MTIDLTGGLAPSVDEITGATPTSPIYREGVSMWIWDHSGRWGLPRIGIESVGVSWDTSRVVMLNLGLPGGRLITYRADDAPSPVEDAEGRPRVLGAGPARFECLEPFGRWRVRFDGVAGVIDVGDHLAGRGPSGSVTLALDIDARMAAPAWVQGTHNPDGHFVEGEQRFEQLFTATGALAIDGDKVGFNGGGLRIHRRGGNRGRFEDWHGHCWQSSLFPSGRAFGFIHYHPRPDGSVKYHEGWVLDGGEVLPARVVGTPWMSTATPAGEDVSFTLRTSRREVRIECETFVSAFTPPRPTVGGSVSPTLQSAITRCRWGVEESYGMLERSAYL